jgi:hypothetical protein
MHKKQRFLTLDASSTRVLLLHNNVIYSSMAAATLNVDAFAKVT